MGKSSFAVITVMAMALAIAALVGSETRQASAKAEVFHVTSTHAVGFNVSADRCNGHLVNLTLYFNGPMHSTVTPSGNSHFHVTNTGRFEAASLDPAYEDEFGRFTVHVTDNSNSAGDNFVFTFRVNGESTSGKPKHWNQTARMFFDANGEPQVVFDRVVNCSD